MDLTDEARQSADPAAQQQHLEASADNSTSRLDGPTTSPSTAPTKPLIELLSDGSSDEEGALDPDVPGAQSSDIRDGPENAEQQSESSAVKQTPPPAPTPTKVKVFLKSTSPDLPLHIFMPRDLPIASSKKLQITIRAHGGVLESRFGKADLIIVDPQMASASRKLLRDANQIGQPIPVVVLDYIQDSVSQGQRIDFQDPKYKYDGTQTQPDHATMAAAISAHASRSLNGRNPFTESDREAIISYFIDKDQSTWSLNAAARELAYQIPSHTKHSFQTYLQANFEKGWNLRDKVLQARQAALEAEPSELQARILRSQYTPSPPPAEQSAPSDGWPRSSSPPSVQGSAVGQQNDAADEQVDAAEEDDQDLEVRQPNPGANVEDVERSPTKANRHMGHAASEESSPPSSQRLPHSRPSSLEPAPQQRTAMPASPSINEESDPEEFSPTILAEIERQESSRLKPSQNAKNAKRKLSRSQRRSSHSSDSSENSESDQLIQSDDEILLATTTPAQPADDSEDGEWHGTRAADRKLRQKELEEDAARIKKGHIKFTDEEKAELLRQLAAHVREQGRVPDGLTQDIVLAKPPDVFWERFAADNPTHSTMSWRSHYLKNRATYKEMIDLEIADDGSDEGEDSDEGANGENVAGDEQDDVDLNGIVNPSSASQRPSSPVAKPDSGRDPSEQADARSDHFVETSLPEDGIIVLIPGPPHAHSHPRDESVTRQMPKSKGAEGKHVESQDDTQKRWPDAATPPLMEEEEEEEEDMMQVEAEIDAMPDSSQHMPPGSRESPASSEADNIVFPQEAGVVETTSGIHETELVAHVQNEKPAAGISNMPSRHAPRGSSARRQSAAGSSSSDVLQRRHSHAVDAGTPVLPQHRDAPFYDFTIDSDEEQRFRQARSRPSLPNLASGRQGTPSRSPRPSGSHVSHFATPSRSQRATAAGTAQPPTRQPAGKRTGRFPELARSGSASPSSDSSELLQEVEPIVIAESSRSRAKRIDRRPLLSADYPPKFSPQLERGSAQQSRRAPDGRESVALSRTEPSPVRSQERPADGDTGASASRLDSEVARMHHRAEVDRFRARVERFRLDFGLDKQQLRDVLVPFKANVKDARVYIERWLMQMEEAYGVQASVAFEYVKTSRGDFEQAETFLRLATMTRSGSIPRRLDGTSSRSASHSVSPVKRGARSDERSMSRGEAREGSRVASSSSKRLRR